MEGRHYKIAKLALSVAGEHGFALAGGYAVSAHGMGSRPSGDVDLFTDWQRRADFSTAVTAVSEALDRHGYSVTISEISETFARLRVTGPGAEEAESKVELSADWRAHPPVTLDVGPVLHPDDAVANKMCALFGRALPRDFLDVDAVITSGRYSPERLLELAAQADGGFELGAFAEALGVLTQITDDAFAQYNAPTEQIRALRQRFADWRYELQQRAI